jgi:hypothetical protein
MSENLNGIPCVPLKTEKIELLIARDFGPRILSLKTPNSPNILAELPTLVDQTPYGEYRIRGGHRLWHAPEHMPRSYIPDNAPPEISEVKDGVVVMQATEAQTSLQKQMTITVQGDSVRIEHKLTNHGLWSVEVAPWAITQLAPGGIAVFPETTRSYDPKRLLPNRQLVLWAYTTLSDPRLKFREHVIEVHADPTVPGKMKIGYPNTIGWQGYYRPDLRSWFIKVYLHDTTREYPDMGCSSECYCCEKFIELETLAPLTTLASGQSVTHTEVWYLWTDMAFEDLAQLT